MNLRLFYLRVTIWSKGNRKLWHLLLRNYWPLFAWVLFHGKEIGYQAIFQPNFKIYQDNFCTKIYMLDIKFHFPVVNQIRTKIKGSTGKTTIKQNGLLSSVNFWPRPWLVLTQNCYICKFSATQLLCICIIDWRKALKS